MKYIKRINESDNFVNKHEKIDFIKDCFSEIGDSDQINFSYSMNVLRNQNIPLSRGACDLMLGINPTINRTDGNPFSGTERITLQKIIEKNKILMELYLDIDVALRRTKDRYNIDYDVLTNAIGAIYIAFYFSNLK